MATSHAEGNHSLVLPSVVYFGSAFVIGLPVMYVVYAVLVMILNLFLLNWIVTSAVGITVVAAAFLVGMWVAGKVATHLLNRLY
ncbi:hypothetical protein [Natronobeatus ordinarius]|uniref:hypothetical protein n=1 Tax=Natronobeatus ordinarius TaxID=2963433 RepID=UPI0020CF9424|nr:hypothetical protein [Natronobeatus ordinarius]